jgi:hypothetical protein
MQLFAKHNTDELTLSPVMLKLLAMPHNNPDAAIAVQNASDQANPGITLNTAQLSSTEALNLALTSLAICDKPLNFRTP